MVKHNCQLTNGYPRIIMARADNLKINEDDFQRVKNYALIKGSRYNLTIVRISDRMVTNFAPEQIERLISELADEGFQLEFKDHNGYIKDIVDIGQRRKPPRFGAGPRHLNPELKPAVHWADGYR